MFWFGEKKSADYDWQDESCWKNLAQKRRELYQHPVDKIISVLDKLSRENFDDALPELLKEATFSEEETRKTLALLPHILKRESLEKRISAEFTKKDVLDRFTKLPNGSYKTRTVPAGILLHVTAGNVFLSSIDSLIMGFLTKNISLVKVSSQNRFFPEYFAEKLKKVDKEKVLIDKFAILHWKGGDEKIESFLKQKVNTIIAWGGEEMIASYQKNLPRDVKLLDFGPKISLQVVTKNGLEGKNLTEVAEKIVTDVIPWDQGACASPQNLYLQEGIEESSLLSAINSAFSNAPGRGNIDEDEATEILKEKYRSLYSELMEGGKSLAGDQHLLHLECNKHLRPSPLHRSLIIKRFQDENELLDLLEPFSYYLQSCSYLLGHDEKESYLNNLSLSGLKRFAPLGTVTYGMEGAPHDGRFVLRELVSFIGDELRAENFSSEERPLSDSSTLKDYFNLSAHPPGYIFSSGGTTGEPKYVHFSYEEFDYMSDMLAENFRAQGIRAGMTVANLFVAGNLWSSFLCVEKALEKLGTIQLPIGGMCPVENIHTYLKKFKPDVVMGIPSMLVMNAEFMLKAKAEVELPMVFYAGEPLSEVRKEFLKKTWKTKSFGSAGYASVDAGVIGYQCPECGPGEHHLFSDFIGMKIIDGEAVVTSLARDTMPVTNYRTGDRIEWVPDCSCGRTDRKFRLLGRVDNLIQIWSSRLQLSVVESLLNESGIATFQLRIDEEKTDSKVLELITLTYEGREGFDQEKFLLDLYQRSRDVKDTIKFHDFLKGMRLSQVEAGKIPRNPRTGKISLIVDNRR